VPGLGVSQQERRAADVPSRVADNLFWLGRHAERAEQTIRLLRAIVACMTSEDTTEQTPELTGLLTVLVRLGLLPARFEHPQPLHALEQELIALLFKDASQQVGLRRTLMELRSNATAVRDRLSADTWRILTQVRQDFQLRHGRIQLDDVLLHLNRMITDLAAFSGMEMENMTRGHGWRFLDMGRRLERALNLGELLATTLTAVPSPTTMLTPLLGIADSAMTYRRQYFAQPMLGPVLDLLLADPGNARSLAFQASVLNDHIAQLPHDAAAPSPTREQRHVAQVVTLLANADLDLLAQPDADGRYPALVQLLHAITDDLRGLSDTITHYYFSHVEQRVS
jgi:uncharacterized alpha-E superfamily protein